MLLLLLMIPFLNYGVYFKGNYLGIGIINGQPIDFCVDLELDGEDAEYNVGEVYHFLSSYTSTSTGKNITVTVKVPGYPVSVLKSTDGGKTFEGTITLSLGPIKLWLLKVPRKLKQTDKGKQEIYSIINSGKEYSAFVRIEKGGGKFMVKGNFEFLKENGFIFNTDNPSLRNLFSGFNGTYEIENNKILLTKENGNSLLGTVYDDGNYIIIPIGREDGMDMEIILVR